VHRSVRARGRHLEHHYEWLIENGFIALAGTTLLTQFLASFEEFPPRQRAASFTIDQAVERLEAALTSGQ
jgi:arylsulfatase